MNEDPGIIRVFCSELIAGSSYDCQIRVGVAGTHAQRPQTHQSREETARFTIRSYRADRSGRRVPCPGRTTRVYDMVCKGRHDPCRGVDELL